MAQQRIIVEMLTKGVKPTLHLNQYEYGDTVEFELYSNNVSFTVPSGSSIHFNGQKRDGTAYSYSTGISTSGNVVTVTIQKQMTVLEGIHPAEIVFETSNKRVSTINILMDIEPAPLNEHTSVSETEIPDIIAVGKANADAAAASAAAAKTSETNAANSASAAKTSETNAASSEVNSKNSENAAASSASMSEDYSKLSESYAHGTDDVVRNGDSTDNSKYYYERAKESESEAKKYANLAETYADVVVPDLYIDMATMELMQDVVKGIQFSLSDQKVLSYDMIIGA